ncbi:MAG: YajD family HNH nuclease [Gammaproteobacteria bacterium]|nr:YajD family HNH nuclease [Gammaproteobacteria bacterium]
MPAHKSNSNKLDKLVAESRRQAEARGHGYREQALKMYPWVCGRCGREFTRENVRELTVHHRNHDHDYNPPDGSNWELLCIYCHDNEHSRQLDHQAGELASDSKEKTATYRPFEGLKDLLKQQD